MSIADKKDKEVKVRQLKLQGMEIPDSVDAEFKAQENHSKMAETPVPSLILSLSVSTVLTMLIATTYNIVDTYFVSDLGGSQVAAVGIMFSVRAGPLSRGTPAPSKMRPSRCSEKDTIMGLPKKRTGSVVLTPCVPLNTCSVTKSLFSLMTLA